MAVLKIKRRTTGASGSPASLASGELAFNEVDGVLYYGRGDNGSGTATSIASIGGDGAYVARTGNQSIDGIKTFTSSPIVPDATTATQAASKGQVDTAIATRAPLASPALTGTPTTPTAAVDTNTTQIASTAFVLGQAGSAAPTMNGTAAAGTSPRFARQDHVHPTDTSRAPVASPALTGTPTAPTATPGTNTTQIATTAFVQAGLGFKADIASPAFTGVPTAPTATSGTNTTQLATTAFVQNAVQSAAAGIDSKQSVRVVATSNITLSGLQTIDTFTLSAGDRVLVVAQSTASQNGVYTAASGAWSRATTEDESSELTPGAFWFVEQGSTWGRTQWRCNNTGTITVGSTAIEIVQFGAATMFSAGNGLSLSGTVFAAVGTANRVTVSGAGIDIASNYAGQTSIVTVGSITTGTWNGTTIALARGGTGANLSAAADGTIFKKVGTALVAATEGTDFLSQASVIDGGTF